MNILWHNGEFKDDSAPVFSAHDRVRYGDGVFDTILAVDGNLVHANRHLARLLKNAKLMGIAVPYTAKALEETASSLLLKNNITAKRIAINTIITRGASERGLAPPEDQRPTVIMKAAPVPDTFPPVKAIIAQSVRRNEGSPLSWIKSLNYGDNILALKEASEKNANEAILLNNQERVTCATAGNIFIVREGALVTPPLLDGVLDGITRSLLIEKYDVIERSLTPDDLETAQGIYVTNSIRGAVPVSSLDGELLAAPSIEIDKDFHLT